MIDGTILAIIPPIIASVMTYIVSNKRARILQAKLLADMQSHAIEQIRIAEEKMRAEIWLELQKVRDENDELKQDLQKQKGEILELKQQLDASSELRLKLMQQVRSLEQLVETYKNRILELERRDLR